MENKGKISWIDRGFAGNFLIIILLLLIPFLLGGKMANINIRTTTSNSIKKLAEKFKKGDLTSMDLAMHRVVLSNLESHFARFNEVHLELVGAAADGEELEAHVTLYDIVEEQYTQVKAALDGAIEAATDASVAYASVRTQAHQANDIRLEKIHLPTFAGEFNKWIGFRDMFEAMVHKREAFSVAAKYTHLMKALKGDALQVVAGFLPTDDNYEAAWKTLKARYNNDRLIVSSHLSIFLGMESLTKESNSGLRRIVDVTNETTRSLKAMKRPVEHWDDMLVHIIISKLPKASVIHWEMTQKGTELPTLIDLLQFLEGRARGLDHMGPSTVEKAGAGSSSNLSKNWPTSTRVHTNTGATPKLVRSNLPKVERGRCSFCSGDHFIGKCPKLESYLPSDRFSKIKDSNLCYNCLNPGHSTPNCNSRYCCMKCGGQHHTILCRTQANAAPPAAESSLDQA